MKFRKPKNSFLLSCLVTVFVFTSLNVCYASSPFSDDWGTIFNSVGYNYTTSGGYVQAAQMCLWGSGLMDPTNGQTIDGYYGPITYNAVDTYQSRHGLSQDGIVGTNTWRKFQSYVIYTGNSGSVQTFEYRYSYNGVYYDPAPFRWDSYNKWYVQIANNWWKIGIGFNQVTYIPL